MADDWPDPREAADAAQFVAAMRTLRARTDLSYRVIERRAAKAGTSLPSSTVSGALSRDTLPRADLLATFIRACGGDDATVGRWLTARADLAASEQAPPAAASAAGTARRADPGAAELAAPVERATEPASPAGPAAETAPLVESLSTEPSSAETAAPAEPATAAGPAGPVELAAAEPAAAGSAAPGGSAAPAGSAAPVEPAGTAPAPESTPQPKPVTRRRWPVLAVAAAVVLVAAGLLVLVPSRDQAAPSPTTPATSAAPASAKAGPPTGPARMRLAHTGLCVGEGTEKFVPGERIVLGQQDCATAAPPMSVEAVDGGYRLLLHSPDNGEGCVTVDYGGTNAEVLLAGDNCEPGRADQRFTFEPVTAPTPGYLLKSAAGAKWCIGVYQGSSEAGVQLIQGPCDGGPHQVFLVEAA
ncbi:RICIN domain-containing protein [Amycolatopsis eburnea]|uniref:XRE family transcriptional regulator n=1 Tax=Amycolatopsis eburnea TaxID=2267691 RepID=A0A3R9DWN7_9PSEU|nr:RICIN domain-containing protein [Amycolatopsis eburnea]RSD17162.1 hypothetical protein EIY87_20465 [Amycolatopsis eburnea]